MNSNIRISATCASAMALALAFSTPASAQMSTAPQMTVKTLAENDKATVSETISKPGEVSPTASRLGGFYYYVQGGTIERTFADGTKNTVVRKTGQALINTEKRPYAAKNVGTTTIHLILFKMK